MTIETINPKHEIYAVHDIVADVLEEHRTQAVDRKVNLIGSYLMRQLVNSVRHAPGPHTKWTPGVGHEWFSVKPEVLTEIARPKVAELFRGQWQVEFRADAGRNTYVLAGIFPDAATALGVATYRMYRSLSEIKEMDGAEAPVLSSKPEGFEIFRKNEDGSEFHRYHVSIPGH